MYFMLVPVAISFLFIFASHIQFWQMGRRKKLPPGPKPLPFIGSLHLLGDKPHQSLARLAKLHGPLMLLRLGFVNTVVISSAAMAREVMQKQDLAFSSRKIPAALRAGDHYKYSVVWLPVAPRWRTLRKVLNSNMFSGSRLDANQELRATKVKELIEYCRKSGRNGEAVDIGRAAFRTSLNLLSNTIFSKDLTDPFSDSGKDFKDLVRKITIQIGVPNLVDFFPFLEKLDPQGACRRLAGYFGKVMDLFHGLIAERLKQKTDLFVAGTDTTSSTVEWAMAEALKNPETMRKAKAELEEVIGKGKVINEEDTTRLPYLQSMVKETLRLHPAVQFLAPRRVEHDEQICGYTVPENSQVLVNVWAMGRDGEVWPDPMEFKPERFLEWEIDVRGGHFELIPFGAGRRICPGLPLAIRLVPVMLGSFLNCFDWKLDGGIEAGDLDMEEKFGITLQKAQPLRAIPIPL